MFALVCPFSQSFDDIWFTYKIPEKLVSNIQKWMVVFVPFWSKIVFWVVLDILSSSNFDHTKMKEISSLYSEDIFLWDYRVELVKWISQNYFCLIHQSLWLFFPRNLVQKFEKQTFKFSQIPEFNYKFEYKKSLNSKQNDIYQSILNKNEKKFLLYWVTGSGKTEIYIHLIKKYLDEWKQSLLLVPEIILTNQIFERITKVFWEEVIILNSSVSEAKKTKYWDAIHQNKAKIIIGTRSSLFYPYQNLWIIIVDEEHDNSYISDNSPRYDAIEVALKISNLSDVKILLWSGTPKINHLYRGLHWEFEVLNLFEEYK